MGLGFIAPSLDDNLQTVVESKRGHVCATETYNYITNEHV